MTMCHLKKPNEKKEELSTWKAAAKAQRIAVVDLGKKVAESASIAKSLQNRTVCNDYRKGRCHRGANCRYAHVLEPTLDVMKAQNGAGDGAVTGGGAQLPTQDNQVSQQQQYPKYQVLQKQHHYQP